MDRTVVGLLPAAGLGLRLGAARPKALVTIDPAQQVPLCRIALAAMRRAEVERVVVVTSGANQAIEQTLGNGRALGLELSYVLQAEPRGLPDAVRCAADALADRQVLFAMPDTVFLPLDALRVLDRARRAADAAVMLGVFPTDRASELAPVDLDEKGRVRAIEDKPAVTTRNNSWGMVAWTAAFTRFCCDYESRRISPLEGNLSAAMSAAAQHGLSVHGHVFEAGQFLDAGTPAGLQRARTLWAERLGESFFSE